MMILQTQQIFQVNRWKGLQILIHGLFQGGKCWGSAPLSPLVGRVLQVQSAACERLRQVPLDT